MHHSSKNKVEITVLLSQSSFCWVQRSSRCHCIHFINKPIHFCYCYGCDVDQSTIYNRRYDGKNVLQNLQIFKVTVVLSLRTFLLQTIHGNIQTLLSISWYHQELVHSSEGKMQQNKFLTLLDGHQLDICTQHRASLYIIVVLKMEFKLYFRAKTTTFGFHFIINEF